MTIPPNVKYKDRFLKAYREAMERKRGLWQKNTKQKERRSILLNGKA